MFNINQKFAKVFLYFIFIVFVFAFQSATDIRIYGYKIDLLPTVCIAIAIIDDIYISCVFSFIIGFLFDLNYSSIQGLTSIYFVICVISIAVLTIKIFNRNFITNMMFVSIVIALQKLFIFGVNFSSSNENVMLLYMKIASAEIIISTLLSPITYFFIYLIYEKNTRKLGE